MVTEPLQIKSPAIQKPEPFPALESPFIRAPETVHTLVLVTLAAACGPLLSGIMLFGWRAAGVAAGCIVSCAIFEKLYFRIRRSPALMGRSHAYLTGLLLAMTLPAYVPAYVPIVAAAFAIIVGKAIFGGAGHFLWQPALVGRLAVAVIFPVALAGPADMHPGAEPILAQSKMLVGDISDYKYTESLKGWRGAAAPAGADAFLITTPSHMLKGLTDPDDPAFSALAFVPDNVSAARPAALLQLQPINDLLYGARPGGIGETCVVIIIISGLYLVYRNYVRWQLPMAFLLSSAVIFAIAPVYLAVGSESVMRWYPVAIEGFDVGFIYVAYQVLSGEIVLAAFFLATEMTSRPVTTGGQVLFGLGCGTLAALLKLYSDVPTAAYVAVLAMNTFTPIIDRLWRPRVLGQRYFEFLRRRTA